MKIVIFGANGPTGRLLTEQAIAAGHTVTAVTRHPETFPIKNKALQVLKGDVHDPSSVDAAIAGQDAVLSTLGVPFSKQDITVYSQGVGNIVKSMKNHHIRRIVCVSSSATEHRYDPQGGFIFEKIIQPYIINNMGKTLYTDMRRMEALVKNCGLDWTIVRPSGLFETATVTPYKMEETYIRCKFTSRADLANCMLHQLSNDQYLNKVVAVGTVSVKPNMLKLIMKEAFQKKHK